MPADKEREADTRAWMAKAEADLRGATVDLAAEPPLLEDALFHCQQASEKALKGFLTWHDLPFRKTHSLEELGQACLGIDGGLKAVVDAAVPLTEFAWAYRYPGDFATPVRADVDAALLVARALVGAVRGRLPLVDLR